MANVQGKFYTSETQRRGVTPSSPPNAEDDPQDPISPSSPVSFITLTDTPSSYSGQTLKGVRVNAGETGLEFYTITSGIAGAGAGLSIDGSGDVQLGKELSPDNRTIDINEWKSSDFGSLEITNTFDSGASGNYFSSYVIDQGSGSLESAHILTSYDTAFGDSSSSSVLTNVYRDNVNSKLIAGINLTVNNSLGGLGVSISTDTGMIVTDSIDSKGLENAGDYEPNFTARSLVTKQYVDGLVGGGLPPIDGSYASQALMIADQANQTAQYVYFDGTEYWEYLGTTTPSIADYRAISAGSGISDAPNDGFAYARKSLGWSQLSPYDLAQVGATDGQFLAWNTANSRYQPVTSGEWFVVGSDIYRNSSVAIGRTTIPSNNTFSVQSRSSTGTHKFFQVFNNSGSELFNLFQDGTFDAISSSFRIGNPTSPTSFGTTIKGNSTSNVVFRIDNSANTILCQIFGDTTTEFRGTSMRIGNPTSPTSFGTTIKGAASTGFDIFRLDNSSNVAVFSIKGTGLITLSNNSNFEFSTITGTKIGTATTQKLSFWNATPIIQPTTGGASGTLVSNAGTTLTSTDTIDGYTIQQFIRAVRSTGLLA